MKRRVLNKVLLSFLMMILLMVIGCSHDDVAVQNLPITHGISGTVTDANSAGVLGVTINLTGESSSSTKTDSSGKYEIHILKNGIYTVTPSLAGYTFSPANTTVTLSNNNGTANFTATTSSSKAGTFPQDDLTGTWHVHMLRAGSTSKWQYFTLAVDSTGTLSFTDCLDSKTSTSCPTDTIKWMINANGVISETDNGTKTASHYTMTSNNNFIAGTQGVIGGTTPQLLIAQKMVPGTTYSAADLQNTSAAYHELWVGSDNEWSYGVATTDATGTLNVVSETTPSGTSVLGTKGTLSVDSNGFVKDSELPSYWGFLSADKKTMVATKSSIGSGGSQALMIINFTTGQSETVGAVPAGTFYRHELACGASPAPWWDHKTITVTSGGGITFSDFVSSSSSVTAPTGTFTGSISDASGTIAISGMKSYHGQISYDGKFVVSTQTNDSGIYSLSVMTR
jgi:hypothetical protein